MKKQISFITAISISLFLFSCSKDQVEIKESQMTIQQNSASINTINNIYINPLLIKLDGSYQFNGNLNDATGKLAPGVSIGSAPQYTADRKGFLNSALKLNGSGFVKLFYVPQQTSSSISVWVKTSDINQNLGIVSGNAQGLSVFQNPGKYVGALTIVSNGFSISSASYKEFSNLNWHHIAVTYDGNTFKFYFDGSLAGSSSMPGSISSALTNYIVGNGYWKGAVDDLRFYARTLSPTEVQSLHNL